jgi:hypothetical protein
VTAASVVDHVEPHWGDWAAFVTGKLQSLWEPSHKSAKRQIELRGYRCDIGLDGFPTDPNHPIQPCTLIRDQCAAGQRAIAAR